LGLGNWTHYAVIPAFSTNSLRCCRSYLPLQQITWSCRCTGKLRLRRKLRPALQRAAN